MPDISMCADITCPARVNCYRYRAEPCEWRQSWMAFKHDPETGDCDSFWDLREHAPTPIRTLEDADRSK